ALLGSRLAGAPADKGAEPPAAVVACRVAVEISDGREFVALELTDPGLIRKLVLDPLAKARDDARPAKYKILGYLGMVGKDGSRERFVLFQPWGRLKYQGKYRIADFTELRREFKRALARAAQRL